MIDILRDYLAGAASPEFTQTIEEAHAALDALQLPDYSDDFVEILMTDDGTDQGQTVQHIYDTTREILVTLLKAMGVEPSEDARVSHLTTLLTGLHAIESYQDPRIILQHCAMDLHPEELLAEILSVTTSHTAEELLVDIHGVSQRTIQKIIEVTNERVELEEPDEHSTVREKYLDAYRRFKNHVGGLDLIMDHYIASGVDFGYPFTIYANLVGRAFEGMPVQNIAANLVSMAIISTDGYENPRAIIKAHIEDFINDLDLLTKADIAIGDLLLKCEIKETTGIKHG
jgi:hypothetical protein